MDLEIQVAGHERGTGAAAKLHFFTQKCVQYRRRMRTVCVSEEAEHPHNIMSEKSFLANFPSNYFNTHNLQALFLESFLYERATVAGRTPATYLYHTDVWPGVFYLFTSSWLHGDNGGVWLSPRHLGKANSASLMLQRKRQETDRIHREKCYSINQLDGEV